ncbi:MAG TPA: hypothetical protein VM163_11235 [bacterium]|nr:hypothetical protein [bacterium]
MSDPRDELEGKMSGYSYGRCAKLCHSGVAWSLARQKDEEPGYQGSTYCNDAHTSSLFYDDEKYTGCAHCCDERFSTMLTGGFQYAVSHDLPLPSTRAEDLTEFSGPVLEGLLYEGGCQIPPGYNNDLGQMIGEMIDFANAFSAYLGGQGVGSCAQTYGAGLGVPDVPDDNTLMGYCNAPATPLETW